MKSAKKQEIQKYLRKLCKNKGQFYNVDDEGNV